MKAILLSLVILSLSLAITSCTKEGSLGPVGETGAVGPRGSEGPEGPMGNIVGAVTDTTDVIYSSWIKKTQSDWTGIGSKTIKTDISAPALTAAIASEGAVLVFINYEGQNNKLLPYFDSNIGIHFDFSVAAGIITVRGFRLDNQVLNAVGDLSFRYLLIPGDAHARKRAGLTDNTDYHAVCSYYHIPE